MKCILDPSGECRGKFDAPERFTCLRCINAHSISTVVTLGEVLEQVRMFVTLRDSAMVIAIYQEVIQAHFLLRKWFKHYEPTEFKIMEERDKKSFEEMKRRVERFLGKDLTYRT